LEVAKEEEQNNLFPFRTYQAVLPAAKLPWPHHDPDLSQSQYDKLIDDLWVINNFGQYQGASTKESVYFHDGLDVVLDNGTHIFAIDSGTVRHINIAGPYYSSVVVEDKNKPDFAWIYTHVYGFKVKVGDYLPQGTHIADVSFQGLEHIHLGRAYINSGGSWHNMNDWHYIHPDGNFVYKDTQPPIIEKPFYYFHNNSDTLFTGGQAIAVSGDVDIVAGIRDPGEYAHSKDAPVPILDKPFGFSNNNSGRQFLCGSFADALGCVGKIASIGDPGRNAYSITASYGDRLCVARMEYEISGDQIQTVPCKSFNFTKICFNLSPTLGLRDYKRVLTVYRFYYAIHPYGPLGYDKIFSYYNITNTDGKNESGLIDPSLSSCSWNTGSVSGNGTAVFPNGKYRITITAYDFKGNSARESDYVYVKN
jgi:hypothetical protein